MIIRLFWGTSGFDSRLSRNFFLIELNVDGYHSNRLEKCYRLIYLLVYLKMIIRLFWGTSGFDSRLSRNFFLIELNVDGYHSICLEKCYRLICLLISWVDSHFWNLNFIGFVLAIAVVPRSGARGRRVRRRIARFRVFAARERRRPAAVAAVVRTDVLSRVLHHLLRDQTRMAQFRIVEILSSN